MKITRLILLVSFFIILYAFLFPSISSSLQNTVTVSSKQITYNLEASTNSSLELFLNGIHKDDGDMIQVEIDDVINITVFYRETENGVHIPNATVLLIGWSNLSETNNQYYNITIKANDLEQGITILNIIAEKENFQPQSVQFFIEVVEKESQLELFLNGFNITLNPLIDTTIRNILNITIKYTDRQTGVHIINATVQLIGEGLILNLTENLDMRQHYLLLDTRDIGIGVKLFNIIAQAPNYLIKIINLRITVNKIIGTISQENGGIPIEVYEGENVLLKIILTDNQNHTIKNGTVTYNWVYGLGELEDLDNDGIYNATLLNVQEGVYSITISAFAGDEYTFENYIITLIVNPSPPKWPFRFLRSIPGYDITIIYLLVIIGIMAYLTKRKFKIKEKHL